MKKKQTLLYMVILLCTLGGCLSTENTGSQAAAQSMGQVAAASAMTGGVIIIDESSDVEVIDTPDEEEIKTVEEGVSPKAVFAEKLYESLRTGTLEEALLLFDEVPAGAAEDFDIQMMHASLLLSSGDIANARPIAEKLLKEYPDNADVLMLNSMLAKYSGDTRKKSSLLKQLLEQDPANPDANVELANEQMLKRNYKLARKYYQQGLKGNPNDETALFGYGQTSYYLNDLKAAKTAFEKILTVNPENGFAWAYLGKLERENENYMKALEYIKKAIECDPEIYDFWMDYGSYQRKMGLFKDAEASWQKAVSLNPDYFLGHAYLAGLYDEQNIFDKALSEYKKVIELNPSYYFAYESLGIFAWHEKQYAQAREAFTRAYAAIGNDVTKNVSYPLMIAATYLAEGNTKECKNTVAKAMRNMNTATATYAVLRLYYDGLNLNNVIQKIMNESNRNLRGKLLYYIGLYYDLKGNVDGANKYYTEVININSPMFFEFRLAEWELSE